MAECAKCGVTIESSSSYGYHMQPIGTADQLMTVLDMMGGPDEDTGRFLAEGWDICVPCLAEFALMSLGSDERVKALRPYLGGGSA